MLKKKLFLHQNIPYSFNWNKIHHKDKYYQITINREELNRLKVHFKNVSDGLIPNKLFNSPDLPRVSQFKISGIKPAFLRSFSKTLIRYGKIERFDSNSKLPKYAQKVFENYKENGFRGDPGHEPILKNILIKDKNSVAIEVPIWKEEKNKTITGHIDLIQIEKSTIKVIDYKPEGKFLLSLPQVAMYGFLLKSRLNIKNIKCISFNKEEAWEYSPKILLEDVKEYLISHHINKRPWEGFI
ncbi:MAG: hypothetical protein ACFFA6_00140 [Promethearchaeota archaeon]